MAVALHAEADANREEAEAGKSGGRDGVVVYKKGAWSKEEDEKLTRAVEEYGVKNWVAIEKFSGLARPAKNCRLRWLNYLRPNLKKYPFTEEEEKLIFSLHSKYGNSWSRIASKLPGRSDNEIKNFWHKRAKKCKRENLPIYPTSKEKKQKQSHTNVPSSSSSINGSHSRVEANTAAANHDYFPTNDPNYTLPQFQPSTLNLANNANAHSSPPQTPIPTPQPQLVSSPSCSLITASHRQQSPTNGHLPHQTNPFPSTPTSQSPHQPTHEPTTTLSMIPPPDHHHHLLQASSSLWQVGASFTPLRKPPILSSPKAASRSFFTPTNSTGPAGSANASTFPPPGSSSQLQWSSTLMGSPRSPLKLKLSPGIPAQYSVQMRTQTTDSPMHSPSGLIQLNSPTPTIPPLSPLKLRLSIPAVPSESCFQSNISVPNSTLQLSSSTSAVPLSSPRPKPSQQITVDADRTTPPDSSLAAKGQPPSIQFHPPDTSGVNTCTHQADESASNSEIMVELREAQARVRSLKKKLRQRTTTTDKRILPKQSPRKELLFGERLEATDSSRTEFPPDRNSSQSTMRDCASSRTSSRTKNFLLGYLRVNSPLRISRKKHMLKRILRRLGNKNRISKSECLQVNKARKENRKKFESIDYMQGSIDLETVTHGEHSESKMSSEESLKREDSVGEIFKRKSSQTLQEQRHSIDTLDHLNSQNNVGASNSDSWGDKLGIFQDPVDKCLNECSSTEGLFSEGGILCQDSFSRGNLFGQRCSVEDPFSSQGHAPLIDAIDPVYTQSSAATQVTPGGALSHLQHDDFGCSFGREFSGHGLMDGNLLTAKSLLCESGLLMHQNPAADLLDSSYLVSKPTVELQSTGCEQFSLQTHLANSTHGEPSFIRHQYHAAQLLNSGYQESKQITERESLQGLQFSLQTSGVGNSSEASKFCESDFPPGVSLIDPRYLVGFENECRRGEQFCLQTSAGEFYGGSMQTECTSREDNSKHEPSGEQSLMEGLLAADNLWPQGQLVSQKQTLVTNRSNDSVINRVESRNWNDKSTSGHTGEVLQQEQTQDRMNNMPDELSTQIDFFPTNMHTLEWCYIGNENPAGKASDEFEFDIGLSLDMSTTSQPLITIADYM